MGMVCEQALKARLEIRFGVRKLLMFLASAG
jgi:hypothetical protein